MCTSDIYIYIYSDTYNTYIYIYTLLYTYAICLKCRYTYTHSYLCVIWLRSAILWRITFGLEQLWGKGQVLSTRELALCGFECMGKCSRSD